MRTLIDLPEEYIRKLDDLRKKTNISRSAAIREAVKIFLEARINTQAKDAFGSWKNKKTTGLEYQNKIRKEWE